MSFIPFIIIKISAGNRETDQFGHLATNIWANSCKRWCMLEVFMVFSIKHNSIKISKSWKAKVYSRFSCLTSTIFTTGMQEKWGHFTSWHQPSWTRVWRSCSWSWLDVCCKQRWQMISRESTPSPVVAAPPPVICRSWMTKWLLLLENPLVVGPNSWMPGQMEHEQPAPLQGYILLDHVGRHNPPND